MVSRLLSLLILTAFAGSASAQWSFESVEQTALKPTSVSTEVAKPSIEIKVVPQGALGTPLPFFASLFESRMEAEAGEPSYDLHGLVGNNSTDQIDINFTRTESLPSNWTSSICFGTACFSPETSEAGSQFEPKGDPYASAELRINLIAENPTHTDSGWVYLKIWSPSAAPDDTIGIMATIVLHATSDVKEALRTSYSVYPNPAISGSSVTLRGVSDGLTSVRVVDLLGRQVYSTAVNSPTAGQLELQLPTLPSGSYFIQALAGDSIQNFRILVGEGR